MGTEWAPNVHGFLYSPNVNACVNIPSLLPVAPQPVYGDPL